MKTKSFLRMLLVSTWIAMGAANAGARDDPAEREIGLTAPHPPEVERSDLSAWRRAPFGVLTTELSPGVLVRCGSGRLRLFANMDAWGLGGPTRMAVPLKGRVRVVGRGEPVTEPPAAPWLSCWFAGAEGWRFWDVPMLVVLQHRPETVEIDKDGLSVRCSGEVGIVAVMPLFGYLKIPPSEKQDYRREHGLPGEGLYTDRWRERLPASVISRCERFARMLRQVPVYCREEFALDGPDVVVRYSFEWLRIADDWRTAPLKLAPLPPALALAWRAGSRAARHPFPMSFSAPVVDMDLCTPYGPYAGVADVDSWNVRFHVMKYVQYGEEAAPPDVRAHPAAAPVLDRLEKTLARKFHTDDWRRIWDHGGPKNYCWQVMGDRWYAKAIPYLSPETRRHVKTCLVKYLRSFILQENHYRPFKGMLLLVGPGIGTWGGYDDAGKFSSNLLITIWNIGRYAGGWDVIRARWPMIQRFFITPLECDWKSVGRYSIAEMGDEAPPALAMARLAYRVGDMDACAFASYVFARELIHHYVKQVGAAWFRERQPWHSMEFMPHEVYLTNLWGDLAGWRIDGPTYPARTRERQYTNRWVRFSSEEVGWFYRDVLPDEIRAEMDLLTRRAREGKTRYKLLTDTAHIAPSILRLRALLLNEPMDALAALCPPAKWRVGRAGDVAAMCVAFLRSAQPPRRRRIIPSIRTNFVLGIERSRAFAEHPALVLTTGRAGKRDRQDRGEYPFLRWWGWKTPRACCKGRIGRLWSFGRIIPADRDRNVGANLRTAWTSWNTRVLIADRDPGTP